MKKSALWWSLCAALGFSLVLGGSAAAQFPSATPKKLSAALDDLVKNGKTDPKSTLEVLKAEFLYASQKAYDAKKLNEYSALRNELLAWLRAGSSPILNQVIISELEKQTRGMQATPAGDPSLPTLRQLVLFLIEQNSPTSRNVLIDLAGHADSGVRYLAVNGLYKIVSDPNNRVGLADGDIAELRTAAVKEPNGPTLTRYQMIFNAVNTSSAQDAMVKVLAARIPAWANLDSASVEADRIAVDGVRGFYGNSSPAVQKTIRGTVGALLHGVVNTYLARFDQLTETDRLAYVFLIIALEKTAQAISPDKTSNPTLTDAAKAKDAKMKLQMAGPQWWGEPGTKGIMEGQPWNLPAGGGLPTPASTQPESKPASSAPVGKPAQ